MKKVYTFEYLKEKLRNMKRIILREKIIYIH